MAGSDDFQNRLNRNAQPKGIEQTDSPGDFTHETEASKPMGTSGSFDYSDLSESQDNSSPNSLQGPGSFGKQVQREKYIEDNNIAQGSSGGDFVSKYTNINNQAQAGQGDGSSIANKYINNASRTNPIDIEALDKQIRRAPLYHNAKAELEEKQLYGDKYRYSREGLPKWEQATPMEATESPDFAGMYSKTKKDLDDIKI